MNKDINVDSILAPIPGENPAGEDLRYAPIYDEIKEARREDDPHNQGDWKHEVKKADWDKVIKLSVATLTDKTKDIQIAVWLTEALIKTNGFNGLSTGLKILSGLLTDYWETVYPLIEEGDLDFRSGPLEFLNDKLPYDIRQVPITEAKGGPGYTWYMMQESRQVGYEADTRNQYGDVDENKKNRREELIAEGKKTAEEFDAAVERSSTEFFESISAELTSCREQFKSFDELVDNRFGSDAPRLAELSEALENVEDFLTKILKQRKPFESTTDSALPADDAIAGAAAELSPSSTMAAGTFLANQSSDSESLEKAVWEEAFTKLKDGGINGALGHLYRASCSMPSVREKNRYRLLMAKLCLKAERPDLARPIMEELYAFIEELHLERWESPMWIAEVLGALYQCLTSGTPSDEDMQRATELFKRICTTDITKAMIHKR